MGNYKLDFACRIRILEIRDMYIKEIIK
jgi:hypothetical protein